MAMSSNTHLRHYSCLGRAKVVCTSLSRCSPKAQLPLREGQWWLVLDLPVSSQYTPKAHFPVGKAEVVRYLFLGTPKAHFQKWKGSGCKVLFPRHTKGTASNNGRAVAARYFFPRQTKGTTSKNGRAVVARYFLLAVFPRHVKGTTSQREGQ